MRQYVSSQLEGKHTLSIKLVEKFQLKFRGILLVEFSGELLPHEIDPWFQKAKLFMLWVNVLDKAASDIGSFLSAFQNLHYV